MNIAARITEQRLIRESVKCYDKPKGNGFMFHVELFIQKVGISMDTE